MRTLNPGERSRGRWSVAAAAFGLGAVALLTGCSEEANATPSVSPSASVSPVTPPAPPAVRTYLERQTGLTYTPAGGEPTRSLPDGPPQPGSRIEITADLYQGDHLRHSDDVVGTTHTICVFDDQLGAHCDAQAAFGGSMLLVASTGGPGAFDSPVTGGTGQYLGATGTVHTEPVEGSQDSADVTITLD